MRSWSWLEVAVRKIEVSRLRAAKELTPCWLDLVAVDRALCGRPVGRELSYAERIEVARRMDDPDVAPGVTGWQVQQVLGCSHSFATTLVETARRRAVAA